MIIFHLKLKRFYIFGKEIKSNTKNGIYFEGNPEKLKLSLAKDKNVIFFELSQKRKHQFKIALKCSLVTIFFWYEFPFFSNLFQIISKFLQ